MSYQELQFHVNFYAASSEKNVLGKLNAVFTWMSENDISFLDCCWPDTMLYGVCIHILGQSEPSQIPVLVYKPGITLY